MIQEKFVAVDIEKIKGRVKAFATEFVQDVGQAVVEATPVKTGFLRGSWWAKINGDAEGPGSPDPSGSIAVSRMALVAAELQLGDKYTMNNGAAYAARMEFGFVGTDSLGRKYNQQPRAFVRSTIDNAETIAEATAERVSKL
jgi:hypothetical protein